MTFCWINISGTAAKIGGKSAYHHFTLLIKPNLEHLRLSLQPSLAGISTGATRSIRSPVTCLSEMNDQLTKESVLDAVFDAFASEYEMVSKTDVAPNANLYPKLDDFIEEHRSWEWIFGMTPKFRITAARGSSNVEKEFVIAVEKGLIVGIEPNCEISENCRNFQEFSIHAFHAFQNSKS